MSNTDEFDDDTEGDAAESNLVKDMRNQLKAVKKRDAEREALLKELLADKQKTSVAKALKAKGADERFAKFYTGEDSSEEAVNAWITENADLIGVGSEDQGADEETVQAAARISQGLNSAPAVRPGAAEAMLTELATTQDPKRYQELKAELGRITPANR